MSGTFSSNPAANAVGAKLFNASYYLSNNADVAQAASLGQITAQQHFVQFGQFENRDPGSFFNADAYLAANPDVAAALGNGLTAWNHFINFGVFEDRGTGTFNGNFDGIAYLAANPDVAAAIAAGTLTSAFEHFILFGAAEGRVGLSTTGEVITTTNPGQGYTLTISEDNLTGTNGNDTFSAPNVTTDSGFDSNTLNSVDRVNGGGGSDTLNVTLDEVSILPALDVTTPTLVSVENVAVRFVGDTNLSLKASTGVEQVVVAQSVTAGTVSGVGTAGLTVRQQNFDARFDGSTAANLSLKVDSVGTATASNTINLGATVAATGTAATLSVANAYIDINSTKADAFKTVSVDAVGANKLTFTDSADNITSLTTTGAGSVDYRGAALSAIKTFDASASTGVIKVDVQSAAAASVKTGSGDDLIIMSTTVGAGSSLDAGKGDDLVYVGNQLLDFTAVVGGAGDDIINLTDGAAWTKASAAAVTGFETLDVSGGAGKYDLSLGSLSAVQIDAAVNGGLTGAVEFANAPSGFDLTVSSAASNNFATGQFITFTLKDATGGADAIGLTSRMIDGDNDGTADGNISYSKVTANGVENVTLNSTVVTADTGVAASKYVTTINGLDLDAVKTLTITGDGSTVVNSLTNTGNTLSLVDASGATGNVTVNLVAFTTAVSYAGSAGVDTFTASTKGGTIYTAQGADVVALSVAPARDVLSYKAGTDSRLTDASGEGKITLGADSATIDAVTNFSLAVDASGDRFDVTAFNFSGTQRGLADVSGTATANADLTNVTDFFNTVGGDRGVASSVIGSDTYVFVDVNRDGNFTANTDIAMKLVGVNGLTEASFNF